MRRSPPHIMLAAVLVLIQSGCATSLLSSELAQDRSDAPRLQRESLMQAEWRGRPYDSLRENFGPPLAEWTHPSYSMDQGRIVIYGIRDAASKCIDAFTVLLSGSNQNQIIADYFCR